MSNLSENKTDEQGQHKEFVIIVNGRQKPVTARELSFLEVVALAFDNPPTGENILFTITYRRGHGNNSEGTMIFGMTVKIKEGMIFDVTTTDRS